MEDHQRDFLKIVYETCIKNTQELPKRRDSIITIYLIVYAAYIGFITNLKESSVLLSLGLFIVMMTFGKICSLTVINFRSWAIQYAACSQAVASLLMGKTEELSPKEITYKLWGMLGNNGNTTKRSISRAGNLIVFAFIVITTTPFFAVMEQLSSQNNGIKIIILAYVAIYLLALSAFMMKRVKEADSGRLISKNKTQFPPWVINFDFCYSARSEAVDTEHRNKVH